MAGEAAWRRYEGERAAWLHEHAPDLAVAEPIHECNVQLPDTDEFIRFEEYDHDGTVCGAKRVGDQGAFGAAVSVLAAVTGRRQDDAWVEAVAAALDRDRTWAGFGRRHWLEVRHGTDEMFHVSAVANRESIRRHGLDWSRMSERPGVAGSRYPELEAVFLCESLAETTFFTEMARLPSDVWAVDIDGRWVESGPSGWMIVTDPIPAKCVRLVAKDVASKRRAL
jgi:hypothetical protein